MSSPDDIVQRPGDANGVLAIYFVWLPLEGLWKPASGRGVPVHRIGTVSAFVQDSARALECQLLTKVAVPPYPNDPRFTLPHDVREPTQWHTCTRLASPRIVSPRLASHSLASPRIVSSRRDRLVSHRLAASIAMDSAGVLTVERGGVGYVVTWDRLPRRFVVITVFSWVVSWSKSPTKMQYNIQQCHTAARL